MGIAAAVISGLIGIGTTVVGGVMSSKEIEKGQKESREMYLGELEEAKRARMVEEKVKLRELREGRRQFNISARLKEEELGMKKDQLARESLRNQYSNLTRILDKNENLSNLFINRLRGLRK